MTKLERCYIFLYAALVCASVCDCAVNSRSSDVFGSLSDFDQRLSAPTGCEHRGAGAPIGRALFPSAGVELWRRSQVAKLCPKKISNCGEENQYSFFSSIKQLVFLFLFFFPFFLRRPSTLAAWARVSRAGMTLRNIWERCADVSRRCSNTFFAVYMSRVYSAATERLVSSGAWTSP